MASNRTVFDRPYSQGPIPSGGQEAVQNHLNFKEIGITAQKHNADLIVMGSHGATGIKEFFVGSNTEKVVRHSEIPVMVIKKRMEKFNPTSFAFASDLNTEGASALKQAKEVAQQFNTNFSIIHINISIILNEFILWTRD